MARSANWHGPISIRTHPWMYRFMATLSVTDFAMESAAYESVMFSSKGYKHVDMRIYVRMAFGSTGLVIQEFMGKCAYNRPVMVAAKFNRFELVGTKDGATAIDIDSRRLGLARFL